MATACALPPTRLKAACRFCYEGEAFRRLLAMPVADAE